MNVPTVKPGWPLPPVFLPLVTPESCCAAQPRCRCSGEWANVPGAALPLTSGPRMAGYGSPLDASGRCRHMADPIKVFWQPH